MVLRARFATGVAVAVFLAAGCKKQAPAPNASASAGVQSGATTAGVMPLDTTPTVIAVPEDGNVATVLGDLSRQLRRYVLATRNAPQSFEDFADKAHVQAPPPPAGQKYAIQSGQIVLVNR
jgi:hypothetical protein